MKKAVCLVVVAFLTLSFCAMIDVVAQGTAAGGTSTSTALTIAAPPVSLQSQDITVTGRLTADGNGLAGKPISLFKSKDGGASYKEIRNGTTDSAGNYQLVAGGNTLETSYFYVTFAGDQTYATSRSDTITVNVTAGTTTSTASSTAPSTTNATNVAASQQSSSTPGFEIVGAGVGLALAALVVISKRYR